MCEALVILTKDKKVTKVSVSEHNVKVHPLEISFLVKNFLPK
jgi:hypothetical protein